MAPANGSGGSQAGPLTAGAWDDNRNFTRFLSFRAAHAQLSPFSEAEHVQAHEATAPGAKQTLDIALVIDTTGSMGDELEYLKTEFLALHASIVARFPSAQQRWSLVVYRDLGDEYVTRSFDFRDAPEDFLSSLRAQTAGGGGDFPEAPDRGIETANQLQWRADGNTARLLFWVADAPAHAERGQAFAEAVKASAGKDIHIYPVASSGIDGGAELQMRSAAQLSHGRYIFLTDDSGVGNTHAEPSIPCYFVTHLDKAILRMVDIEMSGTYREPAQDEIIRKSGTCDGEAQAF